MSRWTVLFEVESAGQTKKTARDIDELGDAAGRADSKVVRLGAGFASLAGAGVVLAGVAEAGRRINAFLADSIRLRNEQDAAEAQLEATIRSTGMAAGFTADELKELAAQRQAVTNFGDELTIGMTSVLTTFTKIRETLPETIPLVQDYAEKLGVDLNSAAIQVGKALNDPVLGFSALGRAGVQFSEEQKQVIARLVETGDEAAAQRIILKELEVQFGGAAEAARNEFGGAMIAAGNAVGDLKEEVGGLFGGQGGPGHALVEGFTAVVEVVTSMIAGTDTSADSWKLWGIAVLEVIRGANSVIVPLVKVWLDGQTQMLRAVTLVASAMALVPGAAGVWTDAAVAAANGAAFFAESSDKLVVSAAELDVKLQGIEIRFANLGKPGAVPNVDPDPNGAAKDSLAELVKRADALWERLSRLRGRHGEESVISSITGGDEGAEQVLDDFLEGLEKLPDVISGETNKGLDSATILWGSFFEGIEAEWVDSLASMLRTGELSWERLFDVMLEVFLDRLQQMVVAWAAADFSANVDGREGGGFFSRLFGGGADGGSGSFFKSPGGAALTTVAIAAGVYALADDYIRSRRGKIFGTTIGLGVSPGGSIAVAGGGGELGLDGVALGNQFEAGLQVVLDAIGGAVDFFPQVGIQVRQDGEAFRVVLGETVLGVFDSWEEAVNHALLHGLANADFSGVGENVSRLLERIPTDLQTFMERLDLARLLDDQDLSDLQLRLRDFERGVEQFVAGVTEAGLSLADAGSFLGTEFSRHGDDIRSRYERFLDGFDSVGEMFDQIREDAAEYNETHARLTEQYRAELIEITKLLDAELALQAETADTAALAQIGREAMARMREEMNRLASTGETASEVFGMSAAELAEQLAFLENLISGLGVPIDLGEIDQAEANARRDRSGGRRQQRVREIEALDRTLTQAAQRLGGYAGELAAFSQRWDELAAETVRLNQDLDRTVDLRRQEAEALGRSERARLGLDDPLGLNEWVAQAREIRDLFAQGRERIDALAEAEGVTAATGEELLARERALLRQIQEDIVDSLGLTLEGTRDQIAEWESAIEGLFDPNLIGPFKGLTVLDDPAPPLIDPGFDRDALQRGWDVFNELSQQVFIDLGNQMLGFFDRWYGNVEGAEELRRQVQEATFELQLAQMQLLFEFAKEWGLFTEEQIAEYERMFQFFRDNRPDFSATDGGGSSPPTDGGGSSPPVVGGGSSPPVVGGQGLENTFDERQRAIDALMSALSRYDAEDLNTSAGALANLNQTFAGFFEDAERWGVAFEEVNSRFIRQLERLEGQILSATRSLEEQLRNEPLTVEAGRGRFMELQREYALLRAQFLAGGPGALDAVDALPDVIRDLIAAGQGLEISSPALQFLNDQALALLAQVNASELVAQNGVGVFVPGGGGDPATIMQTLDRQVAAADHWGSQTVDELQQVKNEVRALRLAVSGGEFSS